MKSERDIQIPAASPLAATLLSKFTLPLSLKTNSNDTPWKKAERATFTLLWTGQKHVFVTCFHVLNRLQELQKKDPSAQIVAYTIFPPHLAELNTFRLVDYNQLLDVAVFCRLEDIVEIPGLQFIDYKSSYLPNPEVGEGVSIVGYPGDATMMTEQKVDLGFMHIGLSASSVSPNKIVLANEFGDRRFFDYDDPTRRSIALGGLSGSPAFVLRNNWPRFIGIVTDASDKDQTIIVNRLGCIRPDGTFDNNAIPC